MKIQTQGQHLRVRIDAVDLAWLLERGELTDPTRFGPDALQQRHIVLVDKQAPRLDYAAGSWHLFVPRESIERFAASLPRRDALQMQFWPDTDATLTVAFEVDVRDSRKRKAAQA